MLPRVTTGDVRREADRRRRGCDPRRAGRLRSVRGHQLLVHSPRVERARSRMRQPIAITNALSEDDRGDAAVAAAGTARDRRLQPLVRNARRRAVRSRADVPPRRGERRPRAPPRRHRPVRLDRHVLGRCETASRFLRHQRHRRADRGEDACRRHLRRVAISDWLRSGKRAIAWHGDRADRAASDFCPPRCCSAFGIKGDVAVAEIDVEAMHRVVEHRVDDGAGRALPRRADDPRAHARARPRVSAHHRHDPFVRRAASARSRTARPLRSRRKRTTSSRPRSACGIRPSTAR